MIATENLRNLALASTLSIVGQVQADLVVLQYHHIDDTTPAATSTTPGLFRAQLETIREMALEVVPLESATRSALSGELDNQNQIAITFDDAYESVYRVAAPLLQHFDFPYTIFTNTDAIGSPGYMTWAQLQDLDRQKQVTIANHSADHAHMARRPDESQETWERRTGNSLDNAQDILKKRLGVRVPMFAYPYGEFDQALEAELEHRDWLGFGQHSGAIGRWSHETRLPRFPMADAFGQVDSLKDKLLSRAFPVPARNLPDGVLASNPPTLRFKPAIHLNPEQLTCFASGVGRIGIESVDGVIEVKAPGAIDGRRFRYNCTHPVGNGQFYWLSQPWLNLEKPED